MKLFELGLQMHTLLRFKSPFTGAERTLRVEKNQGRVPECGMWVGKHSRKNEIILYNVGLQGDAAAQTVLSSRHEWSELYLRNTPLNCTFKTGKSYGV